MTTVADVKVMRLRDAGACACGTDLAQGERAAYDRAAKAVLCLPCFEASPPVPLLPAPGGPPSNDASASATPATAALAEDSPSGSDELAFDAGVAGAAAQREYERRKAKDDAARAERSAVWRALNSFFYPDGRQTTHAWKVGALGEERVAKALLERTEAGAGYALHDRRVPGKRSNIDHLFVGAAGIFVIDAKFYTNAEVSVERCGGLFGPRIETLKVKGRKRDALVTAMHRQRDVVAGVLSGTEFEDSPVIPVLCFVDGLLPMREKNRRANGVRLCGLKGLAQLVSSEGEWDDARRLEGRTRRQPAPTGDGHSPLDIGHVVREVRWACIHKATSRCRRRRFGWPTFTPSRAPASLTTVSSRVRTPSSWMMRRNTCQSTS